MTQEEALTLIESLQKQRDEAKLSRNAFAIRFAEWITKSQYLHVEDNEWYNFVTMKTYTTTQLLDEFIEWEAKQYNQQPHHEHHHLHP